MTASRSLSTTELCYFVDLNFARRLEMAETVTADHVKALQRFAPEARSEVIAGGTAIFGGANYPSNQIVGMGLYGAVSQADVNRVEDFYRSRGVPCRIVVSPLTDHSLMKLLAAGCYGITEFNSVLIRRLDDSPLVEPAAGVTLERVTESNAAIWDRVIAQGYAEIAALPEGLFLPFATLTGSMNFLARVDGVAAGGSMGAILHKERIAALYGSATIAAWRRRGVQTALINWRLWEARQAGCEYAVVMTLPGSGSQRNMERRGFRVAYTKVVMVRNWPEAQENET